MPDRPTLLVDLPTFERTLNAQGLLNSQERAIVRSLADGVSVAEACRQVGWTGELSLQCLAILRAFGIEPGTEVTHRGRRRIDLFDNKPWEALSEVERLVARHYLRGHTWAESCRLAGTSENMAESGISRYPRIRNYIRWIMHEKGLGDDQIIGYLKTVVQAKETKFFPSLGTRDKDTGDVDIPTRETVNLDTRAKGVDMALKVGAYYPGRDEDEDDGVQQPIQRARIILESATPPEGGRVDRFIVEKEERR